MNIRNASLKDIAAITAIYNEAILNTTATFDTEIRSVQNRTDWLHQHNEKYPVLVAEYNNEVVGFASLTRWSDKAAYNDTAELSIYIHPDYQGKKIGTALFENILAVGKVGGLHCILSRITQGNDISIHLHHKYGFTTVGVLKEVGRKFGQLLDVTILQYIFTNKSN